MSQPIRTVVVIGGGVAALLASIALVRRIPGLDVTLVDGGAGLEPLEDVIGAARPSLQGFHQAMGVVGGGLLRRVGARPRVGTQMVGFGPTAFFRVHALPPPEGGAPLHQLCFAAGGEARALGDLALASACAEPLARDLRQGAASPLMGLFLDLPVYREALRGLAVSAGVRTVQASNLRVELAPDISGIAALRLPGGRRLAADLFVDASGRAAIARSALPSPWTSWRANLPIDRLTLTTKTAKQETLPFDRIVATTNGWRYDPDGPTGSLGLEASQAEQGPDPARAPRGASSQPLNQGRLNEAFFGNVVAIGAAAVALEPIAVGGLDLACRHIDRLVALWPGRDITAAERNLFNRRTAMEADHARDFARLHYAGAIREEPFWRAARAAPVSEDLAHDLALFGERGRLSWREDDSITLDERLLVLAGLGLRPRRIDTLAGGLTRETADTMLRRIRRRMRSIAAGPRQAWFEPSLAGGVA